MPRITAADRVARFSARARARARTVSTGTIISVTLNVFIIDVWKIGSCVSRT
jgi:hypothetical protein